MQNETLKSFEKIFEASNKHNVENALAEISSVFISAKPNKKVCGDNQRMDYKSDAYGEDDVKVEFNGK